MLRLSRIAFVICVFTSTLVSADVIISNVEDTDGGGTCFRGDGSCATNFKAGGFTMGDRSFFLTSVDLALENILGLTTPTVQIWEGAAEPTNLLLDLSGLSVDSPGVYTWDAVTPLTLNANTTYWVYLENTAGTADGFTWDGGLTEPVGPAATSAGYLFNGNASGTLNSYRVNGVVVPEPSAAALILLLSLLGTVKRRS